MNATDPALIQMFRRIEHLQHRAQTTAVLLSIMIGQVSAQYSEISQARAELLVLIKGRAQSAAPLGG
jgi:hypothetical protein